MNILASELELGDLEQLEQIQEFIFKEYENLNKNKLRPRSRQGIINKNEALRAALDEFESIVSKYEQLNKTNIWNELTDRLEAVKSKYQLCKTILEHTREIDSTDRNFEAKLRREHIFLRNRRVSVDEDPAVKEKFVLETTVSEPELYFGPIRNPNILSSTLSNHDQSDFNEEIAELKDFSIKLNASYKSRVMAEFPTEKAMQCIPEYRGASAELDAFIYAADIFAKKIPRGESEEPLIQVILIKLKGPAASYFKRIKGETWGEVRENLKKEFGTRIKLEEVFQKIETLEQGPSESFQC